MGSKWEDCDLIKCIVDHIGPHWTTLDQSSEGSRSRSVRSNSLSPPDISIKTYIDIMETNMGVRSDNNINRLDIYTSV